MYGIYDGTKVIARFTAPLTISSNQPVSVSDTLSLKRQIARRSAQRWEISTNVEPLSTDSSAFFVNLVTKGFSDTVSVLLPQNYGAKAKKTCTSVLTGTAAANATQITVAGRSLGIVPAGTFIRFSNHSKIYMLTSDLTATTMNIYPTLKVAVSNTTFTYQDDVIMNCLYDTEVTRGMTYSDGILMDMGSIKLIEQL